MENRLVNLYHNLSADTLESDNIYHRLASYVCNIYSTENRYYHNLKGHIAQCLDEYDAFIKFASDNGLSVANTYEIEYAIWYHDISMEHSSIASSEFISAEKAYLDGLLLKIPSKSLEVIYDCIMATKHNNIINNICEKIITDIDLSILGQNLDVYTKYAENIRQEYKHVPDNVFYPKRIQVLKKFLDRKPIYNLKFFKNKYENTAIENLTWEISQCNSK